tara:strand:- start:225 stop:389 length:165 start_codon:yes stop_codon:yes gene_type:complete
LGIGRGDVVAVVSDGAIIVGHCWRGRCKEAQWEQQAASVASKKTGGVKKSKNNN